MFQVLIVLALLIAVGAFAPSRFATRASSQLKAYGECRDAEKDKNGKCPGEAGYVSFTKPVVKDFATFQAEQKAKKAAAAAAAEAAKK